MPKPQMNGYGIQPVDRRIKTDMEIGGVYRAEFDTDENECSCSLVLRECPAYTLLYQFSPKDTGQSKVK